MSNVRTPGNMKWYFSHLVCFLMNIPQILTSIFTTTAILFPFLSKDRLQLCSARLWFYFL